MEYSVNDLIRILLKKWYIILLVVCIVCVAAFFTSRESYALALKQYDDYTSRLEELPEGAGTITSEYEFRVSTDNDMFLNAIIDLFAEYEAETIDSASQLADLALVAVEPELEALINDNNITEIIQAEYELNNQNVTDDLQMITISEHMVVEYQGCGKFQIVISELPEDIGNEILTLYTERLNLEIGSPVLNLYVEQTDYDFEFAEPEYSDSAELSQTIMNKPTQKPSMVRTVGTAAVISFVLACVFVLLVTFVKDSKAQNQKNREQNDR